MNNVSRETLQSLKSYEASLHEWQAKMNLVSTASLKHSWERHFLDSMQLMSFIPQTAKILYDFGSGAGFPGMVLAIMAKESIPTLRVKLVESTMKKTLYLKHVSELTNTPVEIINDRIENIKPEVADVVTSRALASLDSLLNYVQRFCGEKTKCIFLKGKKYQEEINEASRNWKFDVEVSPSQESDEGVVLIITNVRKLKGGK